MAQDGEDPKAQFFVAVAAVLALSQQYSRCVWIINVLGDRRISQIIMEAFRRRGLYAQWSSVIIW